MNYEFVRTDRFARDLHKLRKKNPQLEQDLTDFLESFDHTRGVTISDTGGACKMRMKMTGKGKSGSYRVVYYFCLGNRIFLLTIYAKGAKEDLTPDDKKAIRGMTADITNLR